MEQPMWVQKCDAFVCRYVVDGQLFTKVLNVFDVSQRGNTRGYALAETVTDFLTYHDIWQFLDFVGTDGVQCVRRSAPRTFAIGG